MLIQPVRGSFLLKLKPASLAVQHLCDSRTKDRDCAFSCLLCREVILPGLVAELPDLAKLGSAHKVSSENEMKGSATVSSDDCIL